MRARRALKSDVSHAAVHWCLAVLLAGTLALPFALRPRERQSALASGVAGLPERKLVIVSPHWEGIRVEFGRAFSEWTARRFGNATRLEWLDLGGTSDALRYVRSEFKRSPDGINVDLFFGGGIDPFFQLAEAGLLLSCRLPEEVLKPIPRTFAGVEIYDREKRWFGTCLSGFGIIYNRKVLEFLGLPEPRDWEDLARPEFFTWVGSGDPRSSGSVHMAYEIILQAYGWERGWATIVRMGGNIRNFSRSGGQVPRDTALGEVACGMAIDVYAWRQIARAGGERMGFCLPEGLTVVNPDGIGILKGAPNRDLAERFVEFVLSEAGQKLWVLKVGAPGGPRQFELDRLPVIPGFARRFGDQAAVSFDPFTWKGGFAYDSAKGPIRWTILNDLIGAAIIDTHDDLVAAWRAIKDRPDDPRLRELVRPPLSEEELLRLARERWADPQFRARTRAAWAAQARERYRRIARGGP